MVLSWVKCNSDDASKGNLDPFAYGDIFRNNQANDLGCFASNLGCDSKLVTLAFKSQLVIPWKLRNRWNNCLHLVRSLTSVRKEIMLQTS
ncbi:ribonuclease H [Trifolium medium]|uniref:Ribonuclease H n=1 Tax=Trifolium medium TaxID=97028 RepID=A0A392N745_9FABA|nr:ribonuclease H [Trifolium medium]